MKAIICRELGGPEKLVFGDFPSPPLKAHDVRITVKAAGVNFPDTLIIEGKYQLKAEPPFVPGAEVAGVVSEVGEKVSQLKVGDRVAAFVPTGGYAEELVCPAMMALKIPDNMGFEAAGGFILAYGTSHHALKQRAQLKAGETLLVLGAAGGVGTSAIQLGKRMGARVIAAASSDEKLALCKQLGADEGINYSKESLKDGIKRLTKGNGADVIYDPVGGALGEECLSCVAWNGRYLVIGFASGPIPSLAANRLLLKGAAAVGVFWGAFTAREPAVNAANFAELFGWVAEGSLAPHVSHTYPLANAAQALLDMQARKVTGKVVLVP